VLNRKGKMKRLVAIGAALLSLSTLARQAEVFCYWGACGVEQVAVSGDENACCHDHACRAGEQKPALPCDDESNHSKERCPCPEHCWCHQAPQPLELPKLASEPVELALHAVHSNCNDLIVDRITDFDPNKSWSLAPDGYHESAAKRCAKLCRFLI
jgi:hypothetical protein